MILPLRQGPLYQHANTTNNKLLSSVLPVQVFSSLGLYLVLALQTSYVLCNSGFESCEDDDDLQASTPQDPNDPECRRHQR